MRDLKKPDINQLDVQIRSSLLKYMKTDIIRFLGW